MEFESIDRIITNDPPKVCFMCGKVLETYYGEPVKIDECPEKVRFEYFRCPDGHYDTANSWLRSRSFIIERDREPNPFWEDI